MASTLWSRAQYFVERPLNLKAFCSRAGFQSRCFLSPFSRSSEMSLHRKSWIIYHKRRIYWASFVICCKIVVSMQTRSVSKPFKNVCSERESHAAATATCLVPEAEQLCQLNGALIWVSVLVLSGDRIFIFGDHFFFNSRQKAIFFFNFELC